MLLKEEFTQKNLLTPLPMESQVMFSHPQNLSRALQQIIEQNGFIQFIQHHPSLCDPWDPKPIWKDVPHILFKARFFIVAARQKVLAWAVLYVECVHFVFSNRFGISMLLETLITQPFYIFCSFFFLIYFSCENAATLLCCEAPEMVFRLWNFTWLSISMQLSRQWLDFHVWLNLTFNILVATESEVSVKLKKELWFDAAWHYFQVTVWLSWIQAVYPHKPKSVVQILAIQSVSGSLQALFFFLWYLYVIEAQLLITWPHTNDLFPLKYEILKKKLYSQWNSCIFHS